ncbi:MAG: hypothetical protein AAF409_02815 [Pseudomonadota bacterium]
MRGPTRRAALAGAGSLLLARNAAGSGPKRVLFIGNSFTHEHDVPGRVAALASAAGIWIEAVAHTRSGASLWGHLKEKSPPEFLLTYGRPDLVVLQDHSTTALSEVSRGRSTHAIQRFAMYHGALVLFAPWARRLGHPLYARPGMPAGPSEMMAVTDAHYRGVAQKVGAEVASVGRRWDHAIAEGHDLHASDGYHANETGAHLTALVLADTLGIPVPASDPLVAIVVP